MTDKEILQAMEKMLQPINNRLDVIENNITSMQSNMTSMQSDITSMKTDINALKGTAALVENEIAPKLQRTAALVENDIAPKVQILLENHSDLAKNVMVAKDIEERVGTLEFEMRVVKNILKSKPI